MLNYAAFSPKVLNKCLCGYAKGKIPTLDLELTAKCSAAKCIYCDSRPGVGDKNPGELTYADLEKLIVEARKHGLEWVYTCGLGEPMEDENFDRLVNLLSSLGVRISLFSNGLFIDKKRAKWLFESGVAIILKLDTFDETAFDKILGVEGGARRIYKTLDYLLEAGYGRMETGTTSLAFSIVPTQLSLSGIPEVIEFAKENNVFPSIGELEYAGWTMKKGRYGELGLTGEQTSGLKDIVEKMLWKGYKRPICPSIITGVHIDSIGRCLVDKATGLNCKWFMLREPEVKVMGNIRQNSVQELDCKVRKYRKKCFIENKKQIETCSKTDYAFGGCGGAPERIVGLAKGYL
jgi:MoaA/NifB/PqqE/SkfB family radical SAM enzyme